ncbi:RNA polymerase subunit sigma-24 [Caloranaerobacter sp. TR13]|uniref:RNA polymerase sigma factor n=1 Tax=Caloranaerobacter sp. TR13 TaxID=1302151 RepID=UPI0006D3FDA7|nr:sigma-70 family RNA polymerase sigma factor [Caloranaerobacter sp. TR13]KPU27275.1 RNA polymerase subunit sigma-24 [Caloranaerobacter sp. TR13]
MEDKKLIKRCQKGDKEAFQELISKYHPFIYKFLVKIAEDEQLAEDLTQDTFLKIIRNIDKFDIDRKAKFSTYAVAIAKNLYIDYLRKENKFKKVIPINKNFDIEDFSINVENIVIDKMFGQDIIEKMGKLTEEQKLVIKMKYIEGLTLKEIGDILELKPKTVKSRIHNGIVKLRKMFGRRE